MLPTFFLLRLSQRLCKFVPKLAQICAKGGARLLGRAKYLPLMDSKLVGNCAK